MAELQVLEDGAWRAVAAAETFPRKKPGEIRYFRWQGETATTSFISDPFWTAGAKKVVSYLGTVNSGTITAGTLVVAVEADAGGSITPGNVNPSFTPGNGVKNISGVLTTAANSGKAAYSDTLSARSVIAASSVTAGATPNYDVIAEVHY